MYEQGADATEVALLNELTAQGIRMEKTGHSKEFSSPNLKYFTEAHFPKAEAEELVAGLQRFLELPLIIDSFGKNHAERRSWKAEMTERYGSAFSNLIETNKLKGANVVGVLQAFQLFRDLESTGKPLFTEKLKEILNRLPIGKYNDLELEEKIEFVRKLDSCIMDFLKLLSPDADKSSPL
jgi:hypothetical protein